MLYSVVVAEEDEDQVIFFLPKSLHAIQLGRAGQFCEMSIQLFHREARDPRIAERKRTGIASVDPEGDLINVVEAAAEVAQAVAEEEGAEFAAETDL